MPYLQAWTLWVIFPSRKDGQKVVWRGIRAPWDYLGSPLSHNLTFGVKKHLVMVKQALRLGSQCSGCSVELQLVFFSELTLFLTDTRKKMGNKNEDWT